MIDRELFTKCINNIQEVNAFWDKFNSCLEDYGAEGYVFPPSCMDSTFLLLEKAMDDIDGWIACYCWDLEFGSRWKPGMMCDENGNDVKLATIDDLYDFLVGEKS